MIGLEDIKSSLSRIFEFCSYKAKPDPLVALCLEKIDRYYDDMAHGISADNGLLMDICDLEDQMTLDQLYAFYKNMGAIHEGVFEAHPELRGAGKEAIVTHVSAVFRELAIEMVPDAEERLAALRAFHRYGNDRMEAPSPALLN